MKMARKHTGYSHLKRVAKYDVFATRGLTYHTQHNNLKNAVESAKTMKIKGGSGIHVQNNKTGELMSWY